MPPEHRKVLREWITEILDSSSFPGVEWVNKSEGLFKIPWLHQAKRNYTDEYAMLFRAWSQYTGHYKDSDNISVLKTRLRCALSKSLDVEYRKDLSSQDDDDCFRVYQLKERKPPRRLISSLPVDQPFIPPGMGRVVQYPEIPTKTSDSSPGPVPLLLDNSQSGDGMNGQLIMKSFDVPEAERYEEINEDRELRSRSPLMVLEPVALEPGLLPIGTQCHELIDNATGAPVLMNLATIATDQWEKESFSNRLPATSVSLSKPNYYHIPQHVLFSKSENVISSTVLERKNVLLKSHAADANLSALAYSTSSEGPPSEPGQSPLAYSTSSEGPPSEPRHSGFVTLHQSNSGQLQALPAQVVSMEKEMTSALPTASLHTNYMMVYLHYDGTAIKECPYRTFCKLHIREELMLKDRNCLALPSPENLKLRAKKVKEISILLQHFHGGITLRYKDGDIFATRHCLTHAFYSNFFEAQRSIKLERGKETEIFSMRSFHFTMEEMSAGGKAPSSFVYIGIGRKWFFCDAESQIHSPAPITVKVKSFRAYDMLQQRKMDATDMDECTSSIQSLQISTPEGSASPFHAVENSIAVSLTKTQHEESMVH